MDTYVFHSIHTFTYYSLLIFRFASIINGCRQAHPLLSHHFHFRAASLCLSRNHFSKLRSVVRFMINLSKISRTNRNMYNKNKNLKFALLFEKTRNFDSGEPGKIREILKSLYGTKIKKQIFLLRNSNFSFIRKLEQI